VKVHLISALLITLAIPLRAIELKKNTLDGFQHYVILTEQRMDDDVHKDYFLYIDRLSPTEREKAYDELRNGHLIIEQLHTADDGKKIGVPEGLTHHWIGIVFIPHATLLQTFSFMQDADHYAEAFHPAVRRSRLLAADENELKMSEQFYSKTIVTVVENVEFDAHYRLLDVNRLVCQAHSTKVTEVDDIGKPSEHELPEGTGRGFLWRINSYWHIEQKDGGVYLQVETIALTRSVPAAFKWVVAPFLKSIPRGTMSTFLSTTRSKVPERGTFADTAASDGEQQPTMATKCGSGASS